MKKVNHLQANIKPRNSQLSGLLLPHTNLCPNGQFAELSSRLEQLEQGRSERVTLTVILAIFLGFSLTIVLPVLMFIAHSYPSGEAPRILSNQELHSAGEVRRTTIE